MTSLNKIESIAMLLHSLAYLPHAAQCRLRSYHLILYLGSVNRAIDSALVTNLNLRLVHVDTSHVEKITNTVMVTTHGDEVGGGCHTCIDLVW